MNQMDLRIVGHIRYYTDSIRLQMLLILRTFKKFINRISK